MDTILAIKHIEFSRGKTRNIDDKLQEDDIEGACQIVEDMLKRRVGMNEEEYNKMLFIIKVINMFARWANGKDIDEYYKNNITKYEHICPKVSTLLKKMSLNICTAKVSAEQPVTEQNQEDIPGDRYSVSTISTNTFTNSSTLTSTPVSLNRPTTEEMQEEEKEVKITSAHSNVRTKVLNELIKGDFDDQERMIFLLLTNSLLISNILLSIANNIPKDESQNDKLILTVLEASSRGELGDLDIFFTDRPEE